MLEPRSAAKVVFCIVIVVSLSLIVVCSRNGLNNQMPSGSRSFIRDHGHHMKNMMLHLLRILLENGGSSMLPTRTQSVGRSKSPRGTNETGPQRAIGESLPLTLVMNLNPCFFLIITAWPRSLRH